MPAARARDEAEAQYAQTVLRALQEVETALARYRDGARAGGAHPGCRRGQRARRGAGAAPVQGGVADFLQVLDAERTQLDAEDQLAQARTDAATAYAALYKALGGVVPLRRRAGDER